MKRDIDLARRILQATESSDEDPRGWVELGFVDEYPKNVVAYHVVLLADAGLIEAQDRMTMGEDGYRWMPKRLTAAGHDFLDAARRCAVPPFPMRAAASAFEAELAHER